MTQKTWALDAGSVSAATQKRAAPVLLDAEHEAHVHRRAGREWAACRDRADRQRPVETAPIRLTGRLLQRRSDHRDAARARAAGARSTVTTMLPEVMGRRSATPEMDGNVVMSTMRNRNRVNRHAGVLVNVCRMSSVPNVEFCAGTHGDTMEFGGPQYGAARAHVVGRALRAARVERRRHQPEAIGAWGSSGSRARARPAAGRRRHWSRWCPRR